MKDFKFQIYELYLPSEVPVGKITDQKLLLPSIISCQPVKLQGMTNPVTSKLGKVQVNEKFISTAQNFIAYLRRLTSGFIT